MDALRVHVLKVLCLSYIAVCFCVLLLQAPLAIGFAVFCGHAVLLPIDGCSIVSLLGRGVSWRCLVSFGPVLACLFLLFLVFWLLDLRGLSCWRPENA